MPEIWILDTETTGLNGKPVEVAGIQVTEDLRIVQEFEQRFNPGIPIEPGAQAIHGITDADVADKPTMEEFFGVQEEPLLWIGHNAGFDVRVCNPVIVPSKVLCTLKLARQYIKGTSNCKLETLKRELNLSEQTSHSALGDCRTTYELMLKIVDLASVPLMTLFDRQQVPRLFTHMPFGKHQGKLMTLLPKDYVNFMLTLDLDADLRLSLKRIQELQA